MTVSAQFGSKMRERVSTVELEVQVTETRKRVSKGERPDTQEFLCLPQPLSLGMHDDSHRK